MRVTEVALVLVACALLTACASGGGTQTTATPREDPVTEADVLLRLDGVTTTYAREVITDATALRSWWDRATGGLDFSGVAEKVDFETQMVLLVSAGRSNSGTRIRVHRVGLRVVREAGGDETEEWYAKVRTDDCRTFSGDAYPVEMVRVRRTPDAQIRFEDEDVVC